MRHLDIKTPEERNPESLLPPPIDQEGEKLHPNTERLKAVLADLHPSKRAGYLQTAYTRIIKGLSDDSDSNYMPADELAVLISLWGEESEETVMQKTYLKFLANAEKAELKQGQEKWNARQNARSNIQRQRSEIKKMFALQAADYF